MAKKVGFTVLGVGNSCHLDDCSVHDEILSPELSGLTLYDRASMRRVEVRTLHCSPLSTPHPNIHDLVLSLVRKA